MKTNKIKFILIPMAGLALAIRVGGVVGIVIGFGAIFFALWLAHSTERPR